MMIYADNAATTRMSRAAIDAMIPCMEEQYGNPSSLYQIGTGSSVRRSWSGDPGGYLSGDDHVRQQ